MQLKIKYNPALKRELAQGTRRIWLLRSISIRIHKQTNPIWQFEIYYRRLLIAISLLLATGWLLATTALFLWLDHTPRNQVGWFDLAAPWRWSGLRAKYGDTAVLTAMDELKDRDYASAFYNLRVGLSRSPANVEGRVTLASLQAGYDPAAAVTLLEEGLTLCGPDPKLLGGLLSLYGRFQIQSHALEVITGLLQKNHPALTPATRFVLQRSQATLLMQLARYTEAEPILDAMNPPTAADAINRQDLKLELLLRTGRMEAAKKLWADHPQPNNVAQLRQAAEFAIALDDTDALQSALRRIKANAPNDPSGYLYTFQAWHRMKRRSFRDAAEQYYYQAFAGNDGAMQAIAALAVNLDIPEVLSRAQAVAINAKRSPFAYQVHQTELALRRGEIEQATRTLRNWENNVDTLKAAQRFYPEFIKRLTRATFAGTPDQISYLLSHLAANRGQMLLPVYMLSLSVLEKAGNATSANQVLLAARHLYPLSEPLLVAQQRVDAQLALAAKAESATAEAQSAATAPALKLPATGKEALAQLDGFLREDSLAATRDLLRAIRQQKPAWQSKFEAALAQREIALAFLSLDQIAGRSTARAYLDRFRAEQDVLDLVPLVAQLAARNRLADAHLLHDEIAAAAPANKRIQQALSELNLEDDLSTVTATPASTLAALDRSILTQEWAQSERLLKYLANKPPAWLPAAQIEVKVREVQIRLGLGQPPLALAALKELVIKSGAARSAAFKLVRDLHGRGERDAAVLLAREAVRLLPDNQAALNLLKEVEAPSSAN